jgi:hypothetical protein
MYTCLCGKMSEGDFFFFTLNSVRSIQIEGALVLRDCLFMFVKVSIVLDYNLPTDALFYYLLLLCVGILKRFFYTASSMCWDSKTLLLNGEFF